MYGSVLSPDTGVCEHRKNADLSNAPGLQDFQGSKRLEWAGNVWRAEGSLVGQALVHKPNKKTTRGKSTTTVDEPN
jgi:hypothetical protein